MVAFSDRALGEVRARRFEADGDLIGSEISVGADAVGFFGPGRPSVDADATGFTVAFELDDTTLVRRFGADGAPATGVVTVGAFPLENPFAATAPDGRSVVAWTAPAGAEAVLREYSAALGPDGGEQDVSAAGNTGQPFSRGVAADAAGFVVVWDADDADDTGVYARRFSWGGGTSSPTPTATATASPVATQDPTPASPVATANAHAAEGRRAVDARRRRPWAAVDAPLREPPQLPDPAARAQGHEDPARDGQGQRQARRDP